MNKKEQKAQEAAYLRLFFGYIWLNWDKRSDISGKNVGRRFGNIYFHHILPKGSYPKLKYCLENIVRLTADEHTKIEENPRKYEEVNKRREDLLQNYEKYCNLAEEFEGQVLKPLFNKLKEKDV